jgi:hypothetical protein
MAAQGGPKRPHRRRIGSPLYDLRKWNFGTLACHFDDFVIDNAR